MASDPHWEDHILEHAAAVLRVAGDADAAEALISSSVVTVSYRDSWSDGHDGYLYDVELTLTAHPSAGPALSSSADLTSALARSVQVFPDGSGDLRKGSLVALHSGVDDIVITGTRLHDRRQQTARWVEASTRALPTEPPSS